MNGGICHAGVRVLLHRNLQMQVAADKRNDKHPPPKLSAQSTATKHSTLFRSSVNIPEHRSSTDLTSSHTFEGFESKQATSSSVKTFAADKCTAWTRARACRRSGKIQPRKSATTPRMLCSSPTSYFETSLPTSRSKLLSPPSVFVGSGAQRSRAILLCKKLCFSNQQRSGTWPSISATSILMSGTA